MRLLLLLIILPVFSTAQSVTILSKNHDVYKKKSQYSSIVVYNNNILLPAERCGELIVTGMDGSFISKTPTGIKDAQIEGAALYGDFLFLLDESVQKNKVYIYDLKAKKVTDTIKLNEFSYDKDTYGIEGIAVNIKDNICYILQEKKDDKHSLICQYNIKPLDNGKFTLTHQSGKNITLEHYDQYRYQLNRRYTDLFYNNDTLYLLGSYFDKEGSPANQYFIDCLSKRADESLFNNDATVRGIYRTYVDLSRMMRTFLFPVGGVLFHTNLEGLTLHNNEFYLVTDNAEGEAACTDNSNRNTLLMKFKKPW
ncbi:MAG: hypothetical protein J7621_14815 [Niastella sp.]|nr:hypothetical protein [Niastella sp.]